MGDKSPKAVHKQTAQKQSKAENAKRQKEAADQAKQVNKK